MLVTLDYETLFSDDYTLKKLTTTEYIRDPRFEAHLCSIKIGKGKSRAYVGDEIRPALHKIDWSKAELLCHHTHFDGLILSHHYGIIPHKYRCTLSMSRAVYGHAVRHDLDTLSARQGRAGKKQGVLVNMKGKHLADLTPEELAAYIEYANNDVDECYLSYVEMLKVFPEAELEVIDTTVRLYAEPKLLLDEKRMAKEYKRVLAEKKRTIAAGGAPLPHLTSAAKFGELLRIAGQKTNPNFEPPTKVSRATGEEIYAFSKADLDFTELLAYPDENVQKLVKARLAAKSNIEENRAARLIKMGENQQTLPVYLNYCGAHTTRWSGGDKMNWQNLPSGRQGRSSEIRKSIKAPKGFVIMVVDSSQIEARVSPWFAGHEEKLKDFRAKVDMYCKFASIAYGREIKKGDPERFIGKTCELGLQFQMSGPRLHLTLARGQGGDPVWVEPEICNRLVRTWRSLNVPIEESWEFANNQILSDMILGRTGEHKAISWEKGRIWLPNGLPLLYPGLRGKIVEAKKSNGFIKRAAPKYEHQVFDAVYLSRNGMTNIYGGLLIENIVQALARCVVGEQIITYVKETSHPLVLTAHDEGGFLVPEKEADKALEYALEVFHTPPSWAPDLPVAAEGGYDHCYSK